MRAPSANTRANTNSKSTASQGANEYSMSRSRLGILEVVASAIALTPTTALP